MHSLSNLDIDDHIREEAGGAVGPKWKQIEDACSTEIKKLEQENKKAMEQAERSWQRKIRDTEERVHELDQQVAQYKQMSQEERSFANLENMYKNSGAQVFDPKGISDVEQEMERLALTTAGSTLTMSRPGTYVCDDNYHLFSDGGQVMAFFPT